MASPGADFKDRLLEVLLQVPAFNDRPNRDYLLRHLPKGLVDAISRWPAKLADLSSILDASDGAGLLVNSPEGALVVVARDALRFAEGTELGQRLKQLLDEPGPGQGARRWKIPARNGAFTGRTDALRKLELALKASSEVALVGMGGVGKTETAKELSHRHRDHYSSTRRRPRP
jgi:hypothetical protein